MKLFRIITNKAYRKAWLKELAISEIQKRHKAVDQHVYVQDVFYFSEKEWHKKSFLCVDGLRITEYLDNTADRKLLEYLRHKYYILHRHDILKRMD